jgi:hypothetical protein
LLWPLHQEMRPQSLNDQAAWAHELIGIRGAPLPSDQDRFIAGDRSQTDLRPSDQEIVTPGRPKPERSRPGVSDPVIFPERKDSITVSPLGRKSSARIRRVGVNLADLKRKVDITAVTLGQDL